MRRKLNYRDSQAVETNQTIRKTYLLLAITLIFSGFMSFLGLQLERSFDNWLMWLLGGIGLLLLIYPFKDSWFGLVVVFAFVGWDGYFAGPFIRYYLEMPEGESIVMWSLFTTALLFLSLSFYAFKSKRDFNYLGAFLHNLLFASVILLFGRLFGGIELNMLAMALSGIGLFSAYILYDTSRIIHGYEKNYIEATVELYLDIMNIFFDLLRLFGSFFKRRVEDVFD